MVNNIWDKEIDVEERKGGREGESPAQITKQMLQVL